MSDNPFLTFLAAGIERGGFSTDDTLAAILPLMRQTGNVHANGKVAPLKGLHALQVKQGQITFDAEKAIEPRRQTERIEQLQASVAHALEVVGELSHTIDTDESTHAVKDFAVAEAGSEVTRPSYLSGYMTWEHALDHHDELTDIFSLGMLLASVACGLDFTDIEDVQLFARSRKNLFAIHSGLNPVLAAVIVETTELNRHRRVQDLGAVIRRLTNYREQPVDFDTAFMRIEGFKDSPVASKRKLIQSHLRNRLFEISHRNRLIHFKPTLQTLNLTVSSVPLMLDYRNIRAEQLFIWQPEIAQMIAQGSAIPLGKYLRFEDAPYISGVLDKISSEARRDRAEYGFAQLRLVLCFLRWNNLKEDVHERIHSPLLLLPVELSRKKGVRDNYVLEPNSTEAEVNPALRHHLKTLYNLDLPESIDLRETTLDQFHEFLLKQIRATEPGVSLNRIDRPQIQLIHQKARQRLDQYRRRQKIRTARQSPTAKADYSYSRESFRPLGLQLFLEKVRPQPMPLRHIAGAPPAPRQPHVVEPQPTPPPREPVMETEQRMYSLQEPDNQNPYSWDFDLCNITLGNFHYRKMTLVRDYNNLIEGEQSSVPFDTIFSLAPRGGENQEQTELDLAQQFLIIPCDATQSSAIAKVRSGQSYIIQGPPGTGKSQTITNLIADYAARGKRVLFVCEKRAAIDVVYHRLRQQGLDELCCLIHDSQTDKKEFIQNLKQTYEKLLGSREPDECERGRNAALKAIEQDLAQLRRFSDSMRARSEPLGTSLRGLLHRLIELRREISNPPRLAAEIEEQLPDYQHWLEHGAVVTRLHSTLEELALDPCLASHNFRLLGPAVFESERPLETIRTCLDKAESLLENIESALELSGLPGELWDTLEEVGEILNYASRVRMLAERNLLGLLSANTSEATRFAALTSELDDKQARAARTAEKTSNWRTPLSPEDAANALEQARGFHGSLFRFLQPAFWRLRKTLQERYDFSKHAVTPSPVKILEDLTAAQAARASFEEAQRTSQREWQTQNIQEFRESISELRKTISTNPGLRTLSERFTKGPDGKELVFALADIHTRFAELDKTLTVLLAEHRNFNVPALAETLGGFREELSLLPELMPVLLEMAQLPEQFGRALRHVNVPLHHFEWAMGHRTLNRVYREDRALGRVEGRILEQRIKRLEDSYLKLLKLNSSCIRNSVRKKFLEHVRLSSLPAAQLTEEQKAFKKIYASGRKELEHEFGKTMRYKSIRDLAAGNSGKVIQDLKPIWLMSPLSISDTLPLEPELFDVVIFDEASQIPVEEAIPTIYRSNQVIVVGDEMQLPPTSFFSSSRSGDEEEIVVEEEGERMKVDLDSDSFLTQAASNLPSTLLAWHYRSRYEALISYSNAAFYSGHLYTIPDRQLPPSQMPELQIAAPEQAEANADALLERSISFHFLQNGVYEDRRNASEAAYIAQLVRALLQRETGLSIGIVAFSEAQQSEIEDHLERLGEEDAAFGARLEAEFAREENDQFCGLFVKNLENVQGDERDIIILSVCYGYDTRRKMLMNFGPINQKGGEKRLNVIFSRAKHHMAVISSIRYQDITNEYNDGANNLRNFLRYAEAVSRGDQTSARQVLEGLNPLTRKALAAETERDAVIEDVADALRKRGYAVDLNVGQSKFRCDLGVRKSAADGYYSLGVLVDTDAHYSVSNLIERYLTQPSILRAFGWEVRIVLTKDWLHDPDMVLTRLERDLAGGSETDVADESALEPVPDPLDPPPTPTVVSPLPVPPPLAKTEIEEPSKAGVRYFEFVQGSSKKFWEITVRGKTFTVRFGRLGTPGQSQAKSFSDETQTQREAEKLISEKVRKGYIEKS